MSQADDRLAGRVAVITGAGQGIGRATALRFAGAGATVVVVDLAQESAQSTVDAVQAAGGNASLQVVDVTDDDQVGAAVATIHRQYGRIDIVVNNAGGGNPPTSIRSPKRDWDFVIGLNLGSAISFSRAVWPFFEAARSGVILNATSQSAVRAMPGLMAYSTAKAGIVMLTKCLALEGAPLGIRANAVAPGWVLTPALQTWFDSQADPRAAADSAAAEIPVGRLSTPQDIANAYLFLASDDAAYVTGEVMSVDGGTTLG